MERRAFLGGLLALVAAPAIVRVQSLMPISVIQPDTLLQVALPQLGIYSWKAPPGYELTSSEGFIWNVVAAPSWDADYTDVVRMKVLKDPVSEMLLIDTDGPMDISLMTQERHGKLLTTRAHHFTLNGRRDIVMASGKSLDDYGGLAIKPEGIPLTYLDDEGERIPFT